MLFFCSGWKCENEANVELNCCRSCYHFPFEMQIQDLTCFACLLAAQNTSSGHLFALGVTSGPMRASFSGHDDTNWQSRQKENETVTFAFNSGVATTIGQKCVKCSSDLTSQMHRLSVSCGRIVHGSLVLSACLLSCCPAVPTGWCTCLCQEGTRHHAMSGWLAHPWKPRQWRHSSLSILAAS